MKERISAILLLAGNGNRLGSPIPKQFHLLEGKKVYLHTFERFSESNLFDEVILVCHPEWMKVIAREAPTAKIIAGGVTRQDSSYRGICACQPGTHYVVIHDGVRPFVSSKILLENIAKVKKYKAVDTCIPSTDTLVYSPSGSKADSFPLRHHYLRGQTPQSFALELILKAHKTTDKTNATDDCSLVREMGHEVHLVSGSDENIKITTETDLILAQALYKKMNLNFNRHFPPSSPATSNSEITK